MPPSNQHPQATQHRRAAMPAGGAHGQPPNPFVGGRYRDDHEAMRPMTDIDDEKSPVSRSPSPALPRPLRPYAQIFTVPGAWRFSVAGVIGRVPVAMFGLGTVLLISASTGKYGVAGAVSAIGSLGYAFAAPRVSRLGGPPGPRPG